MYFKTINKNDTLLQLKNEQVILLVFTLTKSIFHVHLSFYGTTAHTHLSIL